MADQQFPLMPVTVGGPSAPIETPTTLASPHPQSEAGTIPVSKSTYLQSPVVTEMMRGYGDVAYGSQNVPHDQAAQVVKTQGLDPAFIPKDGIGYGALQEEIQRQGQLKINQERMQRSGGPSGLAQVGGTVLGGLEDPSNLVLGPAAGRIANLARGAWAVRAAAGAAIGAAYSGGMEAGEAHLTGHDEDIGSWSMLRDMGAGGALGGLMGAAFGPRALPPKALSVLQTHEAFLNEAMPGIQVTSGVRTPQHNAAIGGALNSMHLSGEAVDFVLPKGTTADAAKALIEKKGLPITEWLIEKKGDPHSTGDHIHWGWGEKGDGKPFGQRIGYPVDPNDRIQIAKWATQQFAADKPVDVNPVRDALAAARGLDIQQRGPVRSTGLGETQRIPGTGDWQGNLPELEQRGPVSQVGANENIEGAPPHIAADWQENLPPIQQRGPATPVSAGDLYQRLQARGFDMAGEKSPTNPAPYIPQDAKPLVEQITSPKPQQIATTGALADSYRAQVDAARASLPPTAHAQFDAAIKVAEATHVEGTAMTDDDMTKAIQSAFNCAMRKGVNLAAE